MSEEKNMTEAFERSSNATTTEVTLMGDRNVIINIITLLSYIRNAINNDTGCEVRVGVNKNIQDSEFEFLVNNSKVDNLIVKDYIEIN